MDVPVASCTLAFGRWRFDPQAGGLLRQDASGAWTPVSIGARARDILAFLLEQAGALVSKDAIMDAVWPNVVVEPNNLTVQIAALRRVLDEGHAGDSCIQTVPGRGYRFVLRVTRVEEAQRDPPSLPIAEPMALPTATPRPRRPLWHWSAAGSCAIAMAVLLVAAAWHGGWFAGAPSPPRLSLVVLPFENLSGDTKDDYLADGITDDLTTELSHIPGAFVVARESAVHLQRQSRRCEDDRRGTWRTLCARGQRAQAWLHAPGQCSARFRRNRRAPLVGSVRRADRRAGRRAGADRRADAGRARHQHGGDRERAQPARAPDQPRCIRPHPAGTLAAAPACDSATGQGGVGAVRARPRAGPGIGLRHDQHCVFSVRPAPWTAAGALSRTCSAPRACWPRHVQSRLTRKSSSTLTSYGYVRWVVAPKSSRPPSRAIQTDPNRMRVWTGIYNELAFCKVSTGHADEGLALQEEADRLNPRSPWKFTRYAHMGWAALLLGRDQDAITYLERSLAMNPANSALRYRRLAAAYARSGRMDDAKHALAEADRLWPYDTVRSHSPDDQSRTVYWDQIGRFQDALRLAGERDHADEDEDFGVPADAALHGEFAGRTPTEAPGVTTIHTADLSRLLAEARPVVIDTVTDSWGRSLPGAVGLRFAGLGGRLADAAQDHLRAKMQQLTAGDLRQADCSGRLELGTLRWAQSGAASGRARLHACLLVPRRPGGMGGGRTSGDETRRAGVVTEGRPLGFTGRTTGAGGQRR